MLQHTIIHSCSVAFFLQRSLVPPLDINGWELAGVDFHVSNIGMQLEQIRELRGNGEQMRLLFSLLFCNSVSSCLQPADPWFDGFLPSFSFRQRYGRRFWHWPAAPTVPFGLQAVEEIKSQCCPLPSGKTRCPPHKHDSWPCGTTRSAPFSTNSHSVFCDRDAHSPFN